MPQPTPSRPSPLLLVLLFFGVGAFVALIGVWLVDLAPIQAATAGILGGAGAVAAGLRA